MAILRAVATAENVDPQALDPLGDVVDPEALEVLLAGPDSGAHVTFSYADHRVVVTDEAVEVY
ncbi:MULTISPECIES: HalOD1 output domain-containing protein [Haloarcula]|uniref:HalOD1 output domain-containing protein n=1 Tax=Haloarcula TaxID=2237 RepID=UPI0023E87C4B|nr:HalOD1 output domain-containing protein [Halomicroarcula sp. SHR3]